MRDVAPIVTSIMIAAGSRYRPARGGVRVVAGLLALLLGVSGCGGGAGDATGPAPSPPSSSPIATTRLVGTVTALETGEAIANASVQVGGLSATTDAAGRYLLTAVPVSASAELTVSVDGFDPYRVRIAIPVGGTTHDAQLRRRTLYAVASGSVLLPAVPGAVRAALVMLTGGDARGFADGITSSGSPAMDPGIFAVHATLRQWASVQRVAIVGMRLTAAEAAADLVSGVLRDVANVAGRPELDTVPLIAFGGSGGARPAWALSAMLGTRVAGLWLYMPAAFDPTPSPLLHKTPTFFLLVERDEVVDNRVSLAVWSAGRSAGALWGMAVERNQTHQPMSARAQQLFRTWLDGIVERRVPVVPLEEESGWLGHPETLVIGPWSGYTGDRRSAGWLPTSTMATTWQTFVSGATTN